MTPGPAGLVVSGEATVWSDLLDGVLAALREAFDVAPEHDSVRGGACRRTWYDTFDWRLYRAGMLLEYVTAHRCGELVLTSPDGRGEAGRPALQPVAGRPAPPPSPPAAPP